MEPDDYDQHRVRALKAAGSGMPPVGAMLSASVSLELIDRMRKGYASERVYRERIDELLHAAWDHVHRMLADVHCVRTAQYAGMLGRTLAQELRRARDIEAGMIELSAQLNAEQDTLTGLAGMDESVISISLIKKRSALHEIIEDVTPDG
jgi:hypothetical protein